MLIACAQLVAVSVVFYELKSRHLQSLFTCKHKYATTRDRDADYLPSVVDWNVTNESKRVSATLTQATAAAAAAEEPLAHEPLIVNRLSKRFHSTTVVDKLTFGVRAGSCFGLLVS